MKKSLILIIVIFFCKAPIFAQNNKKGQDESSCISIIENLRRSQINDSIAVRIFKNRYQIINMPNSDIEILSRKNYVDFIQYFYSKEGKDCLCRSKYISLDIKRYLLLVDRK